MTDRSPKIGKEAFATSRCVRLEAPWGKGSFYSVGTLSRAVWGYSPTGALKHYTIQINITVMVRSGVAKCYWQCQGGKSLAKKMGNRAGGEAGDRL